MPLRQHLVDAFQRALDEERALFQKISGFPGSPDFDQENWNKWLAAIERTNEASKRMREGYIDPNARPA